MDFVLDLTMNLADCTCVNQELLSERISNPVGVTRSSWKDKQMDFDPFCVFLFFKVCCFVFEKHRKFYLSSKFFLNFFILKRGKFRFQR